MLCYEYKNVHSAIRKVGAVHMIFCFCVKKVEIADVYQMVLLIRHSICLY